MYKLIFTLFLFFVLCLYSSIAYSQNYEDENEEEREKNEQQSEDTLKGELQEIVITGTRTFKRIIDIPYSVFRVGKEEIRYGRNVTAKDLLADVPGLFLQTRYGNDVRISIRGFGTRSNSGIRGIRVLLDGIPESDPDGETSIDGIDYTSLGGIEVVKGNLSSLYTNAPGGVINFLSDINFTNSFVRSTSEIGQFGLFQNGLKLGLKDKNYNYYLSYTYRNYQGYRQHSSEYRHLLNTILQTFPNATSSLTVFGNYTDGLQKLPGSLTKEEYDEDPQQAYFQAVSSDFKRITQKGRIAVRYNKSFERFNDMELTVYGAMRNLDFTTNTLYSVRKKNIFGSTGRYVNKMPVFGRDNEFSAGVDYFFVSGPLTAFNNVNGQPGDELRSENQESQYNLGFYFQDQINLIQGKLYFLTSGRFDKVDFQNDDDLFRQRNSQRSFQKFTPKFAFNYKLNPNNAVYTSYGFGFDTPSSSELENYPGSSNNGFTTLNPDLNPQSSRNFELGIKGEFVDKSRKVLRKAFYEVTFFNTQIDDEIIPFVLSDKTYFRNAAKTNRTGIELGLKFEPLRKFDVILNYTFTNFVYDEYIARTYDSIGTPVDVNYSGNRVPSVPQHLINFIAEHEFEITEHVEGLFIFDCDYVSKMFVDDQNSESTNSYFYANFLAGINYNIGNLGLILSGGVNNIFNKKYVGFININANPEFPLNQRRYYEPGDPRNFYLNLNASFRL
ncbi:MAG TPA: TonB-dependent receptor [Ignavibacteria bacterium]|nr:TonB-dependent receptor [Ignavibacteria bacterium]